MNKLFKISSLSLLSIGGIIATACTCSCSQTSLSDEVAQLKKQLEETKNNQEKKIEEEVKKTIGDKTDPKIVEYLDKHKTDIESKIDDKVKTKVSELFGQDNKIVDKQLDKKLDEILKVSKTNTENTAGKLNELIKGINGILNPNDKKPVTADSFIAGLKDILVKFQDKKK